MLAAAGQSERLGGNLIGWVKGSFFKVRRCHDHQDVEQQLVAWLEEVNLRRPSRATGQTPTERIEAERERLSLLPMPSAEYPLRIVTTVRTTGFVEYDQTRYSMPPDTIGIPGTLFLYPDRVKIVTRRPPDLRPEKTCKIGISSNRAGVSAVLYVVGTFF